MTTPDPNNPYQTPQQQHPQQPGGYAAYPQHPQQGGYPVGQPYGGGPQIPEVVPGKVKNTRVMMFIMGGAQGLLSLLLLLVLAVATEDFMDAVSDSAGVEVPAGLMGFFLVLYLVHAAAGIFLALKFKQGGSGIRVGAIVWAAFTVLFGLTAIPLGVVWIALGVLCIVFLSNGESAAWFKRFEQPRY
ncbi:hypothetical protein QNO07_04915 [Streptomyces sp. 549]|uniref:hypothetical protein n=1 Tax=Streptomyces sp. 549 TaxID=3049076 RepID=UPI0024C44BC4|nr:hypothetical protein [Streptomyces sp. 549]MDK1472775.1 hypothetical protein [Streptomyces sp. 549]